MGIETFIIEKKNLMNVMKINVEQIMKLNVLS